MKKQSKVTNEDLARIVKNGFDDVYKKLRGLEQGQEDIKLRLDNVAYRFEVQELKKRVEKLELKLGLKRT